MSHCEEYDLVVLGSGRARSFAWSLASQGKRTAVVERRYVTGSCPSIACLPSKNLIHGAKVANYFRRGAEFGIVPGDWSERKNAAATSETAAAAWVSLHLKGTGESALYAN